MASRACRIEMRERRRQHRARALRDVRAQRFQRHRRLRRASARMRFTVATKSGALSSSVPSRSNSTSAGKPRVAAVMPSPACARRRGNSRRCARTMRAPLRHGSYTRPLTSSSSQPGLRSHAASSDGLMKSRYWCVPFGSRRAMYSAPTIASANAAGVRLSVDTNRRPPGFSSVAQAASIDAGSGTCSSISMQVIASNAPGCSAASASADDQRGSRPRRPTRAGAACATLTRSGARSIAVTCAPSRASASLSRPPPQPTSSTRAPRSGARAAT